MQELRVILETVAKYLKDHPEEILRLLRNILALRFGVPIAALKWFAGKAKGRRAPKDVQIEAAPPGVRVSATVDLMGTQVRAGATIFVERVSITAEELKFEIRLAGVALKVLDENSDTPIAALLKSGALDLSKPGNLAAYMPKRPAILVEAKDDRLTLDLMKHPKFAGSVRAQTLIGLLAPLVTIAGIESDPEHLDVLLRPFPDGVRDGVREAVNGIRRAI